MYGGTTTYVEVKGRTKIEHRPGGENERTAVLFLHYLKIDYYKMCAANSKTMTEITTKIQLISQ